MPKLRSKQYKKRFIVDARDIGAGEKRFKSRAEALTWIEKSTSDNFTGVFIDPAKAVTFETCVKMYLEVQDTAVQDGDIGLAEYGNRERSSRQIKQLDWNGTEFGKVKVSEITMAKLEDVILKQMKNRWAKRTCQKMLVVLKGIFTVAKKHDVIRANPASQLKIGKKAENLNDVSDIYDVEDISALTHENIAKLLEHADDRYYLIIKTCAMTGMRSSEQVALTWDQIEFGDNEDAGKIFIDKAYKRTEKKVAKPKTRAGVRTITLPADLRKELMEHKLQQSPEQAKNNLVFPTTGKARKKQPSDLLEGHLADYNNWRNRGLYPACDRAGIPRLHFRLLRHYFASILVFDLDVSEAQITQEMGHTDISFTKRQYATWIARRQRDEEMAAKKGKAFNHLANIRQL